MTEVLRAQPKIDVVYGHNDPTAAARDLAAKKLRREKEMIFAGVDGLGGDAAAQGIAAKAESSSTLRLPHGRIER
jgi:ribose transport system substrate-binding protein